MSACEHGEDAPATDELCPYAEDVYGEEVWCDCCSLCRQQCADDI